jgi:hypothetical protein
MTTRSHSKSVVFSHPFELKGVERILPLGVYRVVTDEELIEELSFPRLSPSGHHDLRASGISPCFVNRDGDH